MAFCLACFCYFVAILLLYLRAALPIQVFRVEGRQMEDQSMADCGNYMVGPPDYTAGARTSQELETEHATSALLKASNTRIGQRVKWRVTKEFSAHLATLERNSKISEIKIKKVSR